MEPIPNFDNWYRQTDARPQTKAFLGPAGPAKNHHHKTSNIKFAMAGVAALTAISHDFDEGDSENVGISLKIVTLE